jgi:hypothetical protein
MCLEGQWDEFQPQNPRSVCCYDYLLTVMYITVFLIKALCQTICITWL